MDDAVIHPALPEHRTAALTLLAAAQLPGDGLEDWWDSTLVATDSGGVVGTAGLELRGGDAVLRSVAVAQSHRGRGLGERLVLAALDLAREQGVRDVYLLTETAEHFFPRFGFQVVRREDAPDAIQRSVEYCSVCPQSATAMALRLS